MVACLKVTDTLSFNGTVNTESLATTQMGIWLERAMHPQACLAGCECEGGRVFDEHAKACVPKADCSCYDHFGRRFVGPGESVKRGCNTCICQGGECGCLYLGL